MQIEFPPRLNLGFDRLRRELPAHEAALFDGNATAAEHLESLFVSDDDWDMWSGKYGSSDYGHQPPFVRRRH